jgi:methionyl-tRNA formyltransferase
MRIFVFAYRKWAFEIVRQLQYRQDINCGLNPFVQVFTPLESLALAEETLLRTPFPVEAINPKDLSSLRDFLKKDDVLLFYGWSWMVPSFLTDQFTCICLHPSPLPKYRGGSPIQNQVLAGEKKSAITLFKMSQGLDDGPICVQREISLEGDLSDILTRITFYGIDATAELIKKMRDGTLEYVPQDDSQASFCKRRKPSESEILSTDTSEQILNKIRCLQDPYPTAFIVGSDGVKVYLKGAFK